MSQTTTNSRQLTQQLMEAVKQPNEDRIRSIVDALPDSDENWKRQVIGQALLEAVNVGNAIAAGCLVEEYHADIMAGALDQAIKKQDSFMIFCLIKSYPTQDTLWLYKLCNTPPFWLNRLKESDKKAIQKALLSKIRSCRPILLLNNLSHNDYQLVSTLFQAGQTPLLASIINRLRVPEHLAFLQGSVPPRQDSQDSKNIEPIYNFFASRLFHRPLVSLIFKFFEPDTEKAYLEAIKDCATEKILNPPYPLLLINDNYLDGDDKVKYQAIWNRCYGDELVKAKYLLREIGEKEKQAYLVEFIDQDHSTSVPELIDRLIKMHILGNYCLQEGFTRVQTPKDTVVQVICFIQVVCGLDVDIELAAKVNSQINEATDKYFSKKEYTSLKLNKIWNDPEQKTSFDKAKAILEAHCHANISQQRRREGSTIWRILGQQHTTPAKNVADLLQSVEREIKNPSDKLAHRIDFIKKRCGLTKKKEGRPSQKSPRPNLFSPSQRQGDESKGDDSLRRIEPFEIESSTASAKATKR